MGQFYSDDDFQISPKWEAHKDFRKPFVYEIKDKDGNPVQRLLIRRIDMPDLMKAGISNQLDFVTKGLMTEEPKPGAAPKDNVTNVIAMAENFGRMEEMVHKVCLAGILKPKIYPVPVVVRTVDGKSVETELPMEERQPGLFYVDNIPWDDRQELFSVIFDSEGLTDFREEQKSSVGNVEDVQSVQLPADDVVADVRPSDPERVLSQ